jgi:hypothetical protein
MGPKEDAYLVTSNMLCNMIQCLYDLQSKLFALLVLGNGYVFDMPYEPKIVYAIAHLSPDSDLFRRLARRTIFAQ